MSKIKSCMVLCTEKGFKIAEVEDIIRVTHSNRIEDIIKDKDELGTRYSKLKYDHEKNKSSANDDSEMQELKEHILKLDDELKDILEEYTKSVYGVGLSKTAVDSKQELKQVRKLIDNYVDNMYQNVSVFGYVFSMKIMDIRLLRQTSMMLMAAILWVSLGQLIGIAANDVFMMLSGIIYIMLSINTYRIIIRAIKMVRER